ncbi:MAG: NifU family protein [Candidatus Kapabacteria bacterium]|nr:NifU family protein [Candidatus Kapabacteria bacterium]
MSDSISGIEEHITTALELCRPYLQEDGGDAEFVRFEEDTRTAVIRFLGACSTCPMSIMTLRAGIERILLHHVPQIRRVEQVR